MTGMTDVSRHGGDKSNRDELNIRVRDDALVDPELLEMTSASMTQLDNLVDDSDDDDDYDFGEPGPGFAAKVVQSTFKLLFLPLTCAYRGVMSLQHVPWLCGRIWQGVKTGPSSLKYVGPFFVSLFSPSGKLGKMLLVLGTITGMIWVSRKIAAFGGSISEKRKTRRLARQQADEEAALEREILAEEAAQSQEAAKINVQPGNGHRKATAVVQFNASQESQSGQRQSEQRQLEPQAADSQAVSREEPSTDDTPTEGGRKKLGFGQLSKIANAFKRSEPVASDDAASSRDTLAISSTADRSRVDDDDSFGASNGRWSRKKTSLFAAACILLLLGGVSVAKQVMHKNGDVAVNDPAEKPLDKPGNKNSSAPSPNVPTIQNTPPFDNQQGHQPSTNAIRFGGMQNSQIPPAPDAGERSMPTSPEGWNVPAIAQADGPFANNGPSFPRQDVELPPQHTGMPAFQEPPPTEPMFGTPGGFAGHGRNSQGSSLSIEVYDENDSATESEPSMQIANHRDMTPSPPGGEVPPEHMFGNNFGNNFDDNAPHDNMAAHSPENSAGGRFGFTGRSITTNEPSPAPHSFADADRHGLTAAASPLGPSENIPIPPEQPQHVLAATPRVQPQPTQPAGGGFRLQADAATPTPTSSVTALHERAAPETTASLAEVYGLSQSRDANDRIGSAGTIPARQPDVPEAAWDTMSTSPRDRLATSQPSFGGEHVGMPASTPASSGSGFSLSHNATGATSTYIADNASPDRIGLPSNDKQSFSLAETSSHTPRVIEDDVPTARSPQTVVAQPIAVAASPTEQPSNHPPANPTPTLISAELQNAGSGMLSPSQHITASPMVPPDQQTANAARYVAPVFAQTDAPTPPYSHSASVSPQMASPQTTLVGMTGIGVQANGGNSVYVVQPGDSIYKIAKQELGSVRRYREIYDLNRDRLPIGQDTLAAGTELLLPDR